MNTQPQNSLQGLESGKITKRLLYLLYILVGVLFFVIGLLTTYNILAVYSLHVNSSGVFRSSLFLCYAFLSFTTAFGFLFCRSWLIPILSSQLVLLVLSYVYALTEGTKAVADTKIPGLVLFALLLALTYATRKALFGPMFKKLPVISFILILLLSFFITNFNLVY